MGREGPPPTPTSCHHQPPSASSVPCGRDPLCPAVPLHQAMTLRRLLERFPLCERGFRHPAKGDERVAHLLGVLKSQIWKCLWLRGNYSPPCPPGAHAEPDGSSSSCAALVGRGWTVQAARSRGPSLSACGGPTASLTRLRADTLDANGTVGISETQRPLLGWRGDPCCGASSCLPVKLTLRTGF